MNEPKRYLKSQIDVGDWVQWRHAFGDYRISRVTHVSLQHERIYVAYADASFHPVCIELVLEVRKPALAS